MKEEDKQIQNEEYNEYVKQVTPTNNLFGNMVKAFIVGGVICVIGQVILMSIILTGFNIYPTFAKWGGAGALVPITGFANSVASPAIEFKKEGQVFGIGCKIFTIAGPVILYGIFTSWVLGLIYWIGRCVGWF